MAVFFILIYNENANEDKNKPRLIKLQGHN